MRITIGICIVLLMTLTAAAQFSLMKKYETDTLYQALQKEKNDSISACINYLLVQNWGLMDNTTRARHYLRQAEKYIDKYPFLKAAYPFYKGYAEWIADRGKSEKLFLEADKNLKKYTTPEAWFIRTKAWRNYALHQQEKDDEKAFVDAILTAIPLSKQSKDSTLTGLLHQDVAMVFSNQIQFEKAEHYCNEGIKYLKNKNVPYTSLASIYYLAARNYLLSKNELKYPLAEKILKEEAQLLKGKPITIENLEYYLVEGMYFNAIKQFKKSINSFDSGIAIANRVASPYTAHTVGALQYQKYFTYRDQKNFKEALNVLLKYLKQNPDLTLHNKLRIYFDLSETYAALENKPKAYDWLKMYTTVNDSLYDAKLKNEIGGLEVKFQTSEKEKIIAQLEAEKKQAALTAKTQRLTNWLLGIGCLLLLLIAVASVIFYKKSKKISSQQLKEVKQQEELKLTQAMLAGEERERQRLARDLHDGLGGMLAGIKIKLSGKKMEPQQSLDGVILQLDQSLQELRRIARNMMPESLLKTGLEAALGDLCESLMSSDTQIEFQAYGIQQDMPAATQANIYRIVQEILSNAIRHANASKIVLQCSQNENMFFITAEDNGKGFDTKTIAHAAGIGFSNIKNRVEYLKGKMEIASAINEGTTINIELDVA